MQTPLVLLFAGALFAAGWASLDYVPGARLFPQVAAAAGLLLAAAELTRQWRTRGRAEDADFSDLAAEGAEAPHFVRGLGQFAWLGGYLVMFLVLGALPATALYVLLFLRRHGGEPWKLCVTAAAVTTLGLGAAGFAVQLRWPEPWALELLRLF